MEYGLYHGCGNSFLIGLYEEGCNYSLQAQKLCHGIDGLILLKTNPFTMIMYNADGSEASMCGNGIRCLVKFAYDMKITKALKYEVKTKAGIIPIEIINTNPFIVSVNLGKPNYTPQAIGISSNLPRIINYPLEGYFLSAVFLGTDHAVIIDYFDISKAEIIATNPLFTRGINLNFVTVKSKELIFVKTLERGVGWTKACGTGASSSFCICHRLGLVGDQVEVEVEGGKLHVHREGDNIILQGPAVTVKEPKL